MSSLALSGNASGAGVFTIAAPNSASSFTATLPTATTTLVGTDATQTLTNKTLTSPTVNSPTIGGTPVMGASVITSGTTVSPTSSTSIDFTSLPSWVKKITVAFQSLSSNSSSLWLLQLGTSSGVTTSGYLGRGAGISGSTFTSAYSAGFILLTDSSNAAQLNGLIQIVTLGSNNFAMSGLLSRGDGANLYLSGGSIALAGTLDRIRITTVNGTDIFDAGSINILYE